MQKIIIFGATGYFGTHFVPFFEEKGWEVVSDRIDVRDYSKVKDHIEKHKPDVVMNAAGKTGRPNVDWCETHQEETMVINVCGALNIAIACSELDIYMVHLGSGCIYSGTNDGKGFTEEDEANFFGSFYSRTKALSETLLKEFNPLQLRIRIPIEGKSQPKNVIDKLLKYEKIISVENSFTIVEDFLPATYELIQRKERGIMNMTNEGSMDHEFLMNEYKRVVDPNFTFEVMSLEDLAKVTQAERSNTVLDTTKRENLGVSMPNIKKRIPEILQLYKSSKQ